MLNRLTIRTRIAVVFGTVFLALGGTLLAGVYLLTSRGTDTVAREISSRANAPALPRSGNTSSPASPSHPPGTSSAVAVSHQISKAAAQQQLLWSVIALAIAALLAALVGRWLAVRVLRPVRSMTSTARRISENNLGERIALSTPGDEITELADTFDSLLDRLESAFDAQRRFVANASHELRTPLAVQRTALQVGLENPAPDELAIVRAELLDSNRRSQQLIDGLLLLARSQHGLQTRTPVDLAALVAKETAFAAEDARAAGIKLHLDQRQTVVSGDPVLLSHLVRNLLRNAVTYNQHDGEVTVQTRPHRLRISNTGPIFNDTTAQALREPFRRGTTPRTNSQTDGAGLGLSIVDAIATAHHAILTTRANPNGGLTIDIHFRQPPPAHE